MATAEECRQALESLTGRIQEMDPADRAAYLVDRVISCKVSDLGITFVTRLGPDGASPVTVANGSDGQAQVKFTTKSGSNDYHGGAFYQVRNTALNANYYFNNRDGLPRDVIKLTQRGVRLGGPVKKDKIFFFTNYEQYKLPGTKSYTRQVMMPDAQKGIYTYCPSTSTAAACSGNRTSCLPEICG